MIPSIKPYYFLSAIQFPKMRDRHFFRFGEKLETIILFPDVFGV